MWSLSSTEGLPSQEEPAARSLAGNLSHDPSLHKALMHKASSVTRARSGLRHRGEAPQTVLVLTRNPPAQSFVSDASYSALGFWGPEMEGGSGINPVSQEPQQLLIPVWRIANQPWLSVAAACPGLQPSQHPPLPQHPRALHRPRADCNGWGSTGQQQHLSPQPPAAQLPCGEFLPGKGRVVLRSAGGSGQSTAPPRPRSRALLFLAWTGVFLLLTARSFSGIR